MKYTHKLLSFCLFIGVLFLTVSCEKKETIKADEPFEFVGTWNFDQVETSAPLLGGQTDNSPSGTIVFAEDGTGTADYSFNAVSIQSEGIPVTREDSFTWTKEESVITMTKSDGSIITWTIINEADTDFQATWSEEVASLASVDFHAYMSK